MSFENWQKSMFDDSNYDGTPLFSRLHTYFTEENGAVNGFIQFGLSNFAFGPQGTIDPTQKYAIIRNVHYSKGAENAGLLFDKAAEFFDEMGISQRYAFFHFFGMSCYARQGKLHQSGFYMEDMLQKYGYSKEHENVYFTKSLQQPMIDAPDISFAYSNDGSSIDFIKENNKIGGCELYFVPYSSICYLKWIYINRKYAHQGLGTKCMHKLFCELQQRGVTQLDTDTIDTNFNAQNYYNKTGFENKGIMRSYHNLKSQEA